MSDRRGLRLGDSGTGDVARFGHSRVVGVVKELLAPQDGFVQGLFVDETSLPQERRSHWIRD